eukprot:TRINITY_DN2288_c0_g1_i1.p1 TRINITY_DN2288_c0_g1~~TRINITY_DN2288_c0_g1_i1.p1  ORF type:complete len:518 (-),score=98.24 TRINITY_DN2288_c0_g1_i1:30-1583(-)
MWRTGFQYRGKAIAKSTSVLYPQPTVLCTSLSTVSSFGTTPLQTRERHSVPSTPTPAFPGEPTAPLIKTALPGPKVTEIKAAMNELQDVRTSHFPADFAKSMGNYIVDADGNTFLDVFNQIASLAAGYNNPALMKAAQSPEWARMIVNRPALGITPPTFWPELLQRSFMRVAPKGLNQVFTAMCGSCANETAMKAVCMNHMNKKRGGRPFTDEELSSSMSNKEPGSPDLAILSFQGGFHGRTFGTLSTTCSKAIHKVDIPAFDWPKAPFPRLKYPLDQNEDANKAEEQRCLAAVESLIDSFHSPIVACIVEPIQAEGGDNWASPSFFRGLRDITKKKDVAFIVDEVQTGVGVTGKFWAHEHWNLSTPPDIVTFSKKMQAAGFYHNINMRPTEGYRNFNTWMGDPVRALYLEALLDEIDDKRLVDNTYITGKFLHEGLNELQAKHSSKMKNVRGVGTFCAFDGNDAAQRDKLIGMLRQKGVAAGGSGNQSVRLRPQLVFTPRHADQFLNILDSALTQL